MGFSSDVCSKPPQFPAPTLEYSTDAFVTSADTFTSALSISYSQSYHVYIADSATTVSFAVGGMVPPVLGSSQSDRNPVLSTYPVAYFAQDSSLLLSLSELLLSLLIFQ